MPVTKLIPHAVAASLLLTTCGPAENDPGPGGVTVGEAKMLDEAAEMLDERQADYGSVSDDQQPSVNDENAATQPEAGQ